MNVNRRTFDWFNWNKRKKEIIVYLIETRRINHQRNWTDVTLSIWYSVYKTLHRQYTKLMKLKSEKSQYISLIIKVFDFFLNELWYCIAWTFIQYNLLDDDGNNDNEIDKSRNDYSRQLLFYFYFFIIILLPLRNLYSMSAVINSFEIELKYEIHLYNFFFSFINELWFIRSTVHFLWYNGKRDREGDENGRWRWYWFHYSYL